MRARAGLLAGTALLALFSSACLDGVNGVDVKPVEEVSTAETEARGTTLADSAVTTTTAHDGPFAPFTGLPAADAAAATEPALVVKIGNNNDQSRPQMGLAEADIVYEELIEGLKTRFAAVFQSQTPLRAGPVRSARTTDVDLLAGLGTPALVFSGANTPTLAALRGAANSGVFVDAGALRRLDPYFRLDSRSAPFDLWVDLDKIDNRSAGMPNPIVTYGELPNHMGVEIGGVEITYQASFGRQATHLWDADISGWVRVQDGSLHTALRGDEEVEIAPANVVVLQVVYEVSTADPASPEAQSFDTGPVQVFTRGQVVHGTWARSQQSPVWMLRDLNGEIIPLEPGSTWFILAAGDGSRFPEAHIATFDPAEAAARLDTARTAR